MCCAAMAAALVGTAALGACSDGRDGGPVVFAAASLSDVLPEIEPEAAYSFDGSAGLVDQLSGGAPADVFLSADLATMDRAVGLGLVDGDPAMVATNHLVLVVPTGNPAAVTGLDGSLDGAKLVVCAAEVPCGAASRRLAEASGVRLVPVSEETKVTDVLGKVASGEADAGLVYATDAAGSGEVERIDIPGSEADPNTYWAAVVTGAEHPDRARAFIDTVLGEGQAVLAAAGFGPPR